MNPAQDLRHVAHLLKPKVWIYWIDFIATFIVSQFFFWYCVLGDISFLSRIACAVLTGIALHRTVYINHEITHAAREIPYFETAYNLLFGFWTKFPTYVYGTHKYHHAKNTFGTMADPEYAPLQGKIFPIFVAPFIGFFLVPILTFIRFAILPLTFPFIGERGRMFVYGYLSTFALQPMYRRPKPTKEERTRWYFQDLGCFIYWWVFLGLIFLEIIPLTALFLWCGLVGFVFLSNHLRAMISHVYHSQNLPTDFQGQVLDTMIVDQPFFIRELWAPMANTYHTLHHFCPMLPYHSLPEGHRILMKVLPEDHPYKRHVYTGYLDAISNVAFSKKKF